ncbi:hypothetical protein P3T76_005161 [Phytophthora citrophthora]|uniref:RxLR effector protein n=1 Tax=Phytophthora citrophthora TaxID=4793 RepID=A0AAD9GS61_9STRA|nr:hypothetical protein P3T76_005161 [Phytophthora citrophthora]
MRLLFVVTLVFAAFFATANVSALNENTPFKRLLRSTVSVNEEEERGILDSLSKKISKLGNQLAVKTMDNPKIVKATGTSLLKRFNSVDPKNFDSVDYLFRSKAFYDLDDYVSRLNQLDKYREMSVVKVFRNGLGDKEAMKLFIKASGSGDEAVRNSGKLFTQQLRNLQGEELKRWSLL